MFRNRYGDMRTTAMCWGFSCGDGWFDIINNLCHLICSDWLRVKKDYDEVRDRVGLRRFEWAGDKEWNHIVTEEDVAFAKQRMEEEREKIPVVTQVKEKFGGLRFYVSAATDEQFAYIRFAEEMSLTTCDVCGDRGRPTKDGWIVTRCNKHLQD